jgi:hypothetical protein
VPEARGKHSLLTPNVRPQGVERHPVDFGFPVTAMTQVVGFASGVGGIVKWRIRVHERTADSLRGSKLIVFQHGILDLNQLG